MTETFHIVIKKGPKSGSVVELTQEEITIGREASNLLPINDRGLSRSHASLKRVALTIFLKTWAPPTGRLFNGKPIGDSLTF